jgi:elongation factor G
MNSTKGQRERLGRILLMHANHREDLDQVWTGDIAAAVGLKNTTTGDTLCDDKNQIILESMEFPEPVIRVAIEPKTKAGQEKMGIALQKLAEEDPTFKTYTDEETGQTIIAGMGELHLEIIVDRLLREFKVEANVGQTPGFLQGDHPEVRRAGDQIRASDRRQGPVRPRQDPRRAQRVRQGLRVRQRHCRRRDPQGIYSCGGSGHSGRDERRRLAGYPVVDVKVTLYDGSYHEVDSSEMAFKIAGSMAFKEAMRKADPTLLEPIMKVVVTAPDDYMGDVIGDLNSRRGQIASTDVQNGACEITANVPLATMFGYATDLRSKTQGRANLQHGAQPLCRAAQEPAGDTHEYPQKRLCDVFRAEF